MEGIATLAGGIAHQFNNALHPKRSFDMVACFSCHSLCKNPKIYRVYYGAESLKIYAPGNYDDYNEKAVSEYVISDIVSICSKCLEKAGHMNWNKYAIKLWSGGVAHSFRAKCCHQCDNISESNHCEPYKYFMPWWVKHFIDIDKIEPTIDLGPVKHMIHCSGWKSQNSIIENPFDSLKSRFQMGLYLIKYYKKIRIKLRRFLFQDLFYFDNFADKIQQFLNSHSPGSIFDRAYSNIFYKHYKEILESNIFKKYFDTREKLKDWATA